MKPPVICIVGKNKIEKTQLMEALIKELKSRGLRVGALKHHKHGDFEIDIEGKDTWKYANAGADTGAILSPVKFAFIRNLEKEMGIDETLNTYFSDADIVLADGFALSDKPRIILADNKEDVGIFERGCAIIAVVGKAGMGFDEIAAIVDKVSPPI